MRDWMILSPSCASWDRQERAVERMKAAGCISAAAMAHGVSESSLRAAFRDRRYVRARWDAMARMREAGLSLPAIGRALNRHHTSVVYALRQMRDGPCSGASR